MKKNTMKRMITYIPFGVCMVFTSPISLASNTEVANQIFEDHLLKDAVTANLTCKKMLSTTHNASHEQQVAAFNALLKSWKTVEAEYVLGELEDTLIDQPRYIDIFHYNTNQPIGEQLDHYLSKSTPAETALFKHAFNTVNALEYVLFTHKPSKLQQSYVKHITTHLCSNLDEIAKGYQSTKEKFVASPDQSISSLINVLIDSSYKLREWRIGDTFGYTKKFKNKPDLARAEYAKSQQSLQAMAQILLVHKQFLGKNGDLTQFLKTKKNAQIFNQIDQYINTALNIVNKGIKQGIAKLTESDKKQLYTQTTLLQKAYYEQLLSALDITSKILEADGD